MPTVKGASKDMRLNNRSGFTLIELIVVTAVMCIVAAIASTTYFYYLDQARTAVALSALNGTNKALEVYSFDHGTYPENINFSTCLDENGQPVFSSNLCQELKSNFHSIDSYTQTGNDYRIRATVNNKAKTPVYAAPGKVSTQEIP